MHQQHWAKKVERGVLWGYATLVHEEIFLHFTLNVAYVRHSLHFSRDHAVSLPIFLHGPGMGPILCIFSIKAILNKAVLENYIQQMSLLQQNESNPYSRVLFL
jgi:hypothetical protein